MKNVYINAVKADINYRVIYVCKYELFCRMTHKMLFSMIVCIGGFIFSACFCLADMSVPFNPLLTQALVQTGLRLTQKERESE